jgi:outer membrane protein, heavy metal efflux system
MHRSTFTALSRWRATNQISWAIACSTVAASALAQPTTKPESLTLRQAFESAWSRQPEAAALQARREAVQAQNQAAQSWSPEPASVSLLTKIDRPARNLGTREYEAGIAVPLWLPGERLRSQALAQAEGQAVQSRTNAAQLRVAATVREAWWNWQRARAEADTAKGQLDNAQSIAADVSKRVKAGDLARADQHQADGGVAAAQAAVAQAQAAVIVTRQLLRTLTGAAQDSPAVDQAADRAELGVEPEPGAVVVDLDTHTDLLALKDRALVAQGTAALVATQTRANPELTLATARDRGARGEAWQQTFSVGLRFPFGSGPRHDARTASSKADTIELQAQLNLDRARLAGERDSAKARTDAARVQLAAAERRAQLARESRGFFDKSFRMGETDLPTRLRIEAEASEATRQAARASIELAAAISAWRQALGLLPQ